MVGEGADLVPVDDSNLAVRAARLLARTHGARDSLGVVLSIKKASRWPVDWPEGLPTAQLRCWPAPTLWDLDIDPETLRPLAAELGSDVPFALIGGNRCGQRTRRGGGPGARPRDLPLGAGLRSPRSVDAGGLPALRPAQPGAPPPEVPAELMNALRIGDPKLLGAALSNDLEVAALDLQPRLRQVLDAGLEYGAARRDGLGSGSDLRLPGRQRVRSGRPHGGAQRRGRLSRGPPGHRPGAGRACHRLNSVSLLARSNDRRFGRSGSKRIESGLEVARCCRSGSKRKTPATLRAVTDLPPTTRLLRPLQPARPAGSTPGRLAAGAADRPVFVVVAVSQAAASLHHGLVTEHPGHYVLGFALAFFAIWWAWLNFTWFGSAYDNDDVGLPAADHPADRRGAGPGGWRATGCSRVTSGWPSSAT